MVPAHSTGSPSYETGTMLHTQLAKMSFDKIFDLTAGVYFNFYNIAAAAVYTFPLVGTRYVYRSPSDR